MKIGELVRQNRLRFTCALALEVLGQLCVAVGNYIIGFILDLLVKRDISRFYLVLAVFFVLYMGGYVLISFAEYLYIVQVQEYVHQLRRKTVDYYYQNSETVAEMQNHLTNDFQMLFDNFTQPLFVFFDSALAVVFSAYALITMHWILLVTTVLLSVMFLYLPSIFSKKYQERTLNFSNMNTAYLTSIKNWLGGLAEIQRYDARHKLVEVLEKRSKKLEGSLVTRQVSAIEINFINGFMSIFCQVVLDLVTGALIFAGAISIGKLVAVGQFSSTIFNSLVTLSNYLEQIKSTKPLNEKVAAALADPPKDVNTDKELASFDHLQTTGLSFSYDHGETINYPDLKIKAGEKVLLTGDSGTGKSTLLKVLAGELKATTGNIAFYDHDDRKIDISLKAMHYVPQDPVLFPVSIAENITMFKPKLDDKVGEYLQKVDLAKDIAKFPKGQDTVIDVEELNVSGGQRQKIVLARAELNQSDFILIDEATAAVDQDSTKRILKNLLKTNATIIFIGHNFTNEMVDMFDRQIVLSK
jgi:ABC-type bacteriocin/lantibiotic exporter with double-glycine peptidase domain